MAARFTGRVLFARQHLTFAPKRNFGHFRNASKNRPINEYSKYLLIIGGGVTALACANWWKTHQVHAAISTKHKPEEEKAIKLTMRERRFIKFASVQFDGQLYMTPKDFLDSVVEAEPRPRLSRVSLTVDNVNEMKNKTPPLKKGNKNLFRNVRQNGIITYTEYLFLLSILTKPRSGFLIAFNMFDIDGNQQVDLKEFFILRQILGGSFREQDMDEDTRKVLMHLVSTVEQARQLRVVKPTAVPEGEFIWLGDSNWLLINKTAQTITPVFSINFTLNGLKTIQFLYPAVHYENSPDSQGSRTQYIGLDFLEIQDMKHRFYFHRNHNMWKNLYEACVIIIFKTKKRITKENKKTYKEEKDNKKSNVSNKEKPDEIKRKLKTTDQKDDDGLDRKFNAETATFLQTHFFGPKGDNVLNYKSFSAFMENLQTEILEIEFNEFGKGNKIISEIDFARILLRYTHLNTNQYEAYLERLLKRLEGVQQIGIKFQEFRDFCNFLNTLDDFEIAMNMYTMANHPISKEQFKRAIKICTGHKFSDHLIDTVFAIFDVDGDGRLSHKEFIDIMLDRLYRGMKTHSRNEGWNAFKYCVKQELLNS